MKRKVLHELEMRERIIRPTDEVSRRRSCQLLVPAQGEVHLDDYGIAAPHLRRKVFPWNGLLHARCASFAFGESLRRRISFPEDAHPRDQLQGVVRREEDWDEAFTFLFSLRSWGQHAQAAVCRRMDRQHVFEFDVLVEVVAGWNCNVSSEAVLVVVLVASLAAEAITMRRGRNQHIDNGGSNESSN